MLFRLSLDPDTLTGPLDNVFIFYFVGFQRPKNYIKQSSNAGNNENEARWWLGHHSKHVHVQKSCRQTFFCVEKCNHFVTLSWIWNYPYLRIRHWSSVFKIPDISNTAWPNDFRAQQERKGRFLPTFAPSPPSQRHFPGLLALTENALL